MKEIKKEVKLKPGRNPDLKLEITILEFENLDEVVKKWPPEKILFVINKQWAFFQQCQARQDYFAALPKDHSDYKPVPWWRKEEKDGCVKDRTSKKNGTQG